MSTCLENLTELGSSCTFVLFWQKCRMQSRSDTRHRCAELGTFSALEEFTRSLCVLYVLHMRSLLFCIGQQIPEICASHGHIGNQPIPRAHHLHLFFLSSSLFSTSSHLVPLPTQQHSLDLPLIDSALFAASTYDHGSLNTSRRPSNTQPPPRPIQKPRIPLLPLPPTIPKPYPRLLFLLFWHFA